MLRICQAAVKYTLLHSIHCPRVLCIGQILLKIDNLKYYAFLEVKWQLVLEIKRQLALVSSSEKCFHECISYICISYVGNIWFSWTFSKKLLLQFIPFSQWSQKYFWKHSSFTYHFSQQNLKNHIFQSYQKEYICCSV